MVVDKRWIALFVTATVATHFVPIYGRFCSAHFLNTVGASFVFAARFFNVFLHFLQNPENLQQYRQDFAKRQKSRFLPLKGEVEN